MSLRQLARETGVHYVTLSRLLHRRQCPLPRTAGAIARVLRTDVTKLFGEEVLK